MYAVEVAALENDKSFCFSVARSCSNNICCVCSNHLGLQRLNQVPANGSRYLVSLGHCGISCTIVLRLCVFAPIG